MSGPAFSLVGLRLISSEQPSADLFFDHGLNVVSGASDTGKTFALECIDFMLGGRRPLRNINEAHGYTDLLLGINSPPRNQATLKRPLAGGKFLLINSSLEAADSTPATTQLNEVHNAKNNRNISSYLLSQCGLQNKKVLTKTNGTTRNVSFRNIAPFAIISEEEMFKRGPLFLSGQYTERTFETSVFRLLLTGQDASTQAVKQIAPLDKNRRTAQIQLLDELINQLEQQLQNIVSQEEAAEKIQVLDKAVADKTKNERSARKKISELEADRQRQWNKKEVMEAKASNIDGLLQRFHVLKDQYESDRERLSAIAEADFFFSQLPQQRCPLCGAEQNGHIHDSGDTPPPLLRVAALKEIEKLDLRLHELKETVRFLESDRAQLQEQITSATAGIEAITATIDQALRPQLLSATENISQLLSQKAELEKALYQRNHLASLYAARIERETKSQINSPGRISAQIENSSELKLLCVAMEELLVAWHFPFPGEQSVEFDTEAQDFIIAGKPRANFGKGLRAISYAAFAIALMLHAKKRNLAHPGFVILDSPLVTYRKKDVPQGEAITDDVKDAFFDDLAKRLQECQVIVFENEEPLPNTQKAIKYHRFTGNPRFGRVGLLPPATVGR